ncbi:MAG: hypothetical protein J07HB67_01892 [halophilic archaeon J07HB67]|nr:MAG: hypothetical protein J07HB67_01892 [halophilic archaeon J07HB67]
MKHVPTLCGTVVASDTVGDGDRLGATAGDVRPARVVDYVGSVQAAVPLVPGSETDCCARLGRRLDFPSRDVSRTWLTFLRGLGLARETEAGFRRTRTEPTVSGVRAGLRDGVLGAREIADRVASGPTTLDDAFDAVEPLVPRWERTRTDEWERVWRDRAARLCDWLAVLGLADPERGPETVYTATAALGTRPTDDPV